MANAKKMGKIKWEGGRKIEKIDWLDIAWMSKQDGPGVRSVLYLQGCHLKCGWCHSPHSQPIEGRIVFNENLCTLCGKCIETCENECHAIENKTHKFNSKRCTTCGKCIENCSNSYSMKKKSALYNSKNTNCVEELYKILLPQLKMLKNIGGITISGGEAMLQEKEVLTLLKKFKKENINTAVETTLNLNIDKLEDLKEVVDYWLIGFRRFEEGDSDFNRINKNLKRLKGSKIIARYPLIVGYTNSKNQLKAICSLIKKHNIKTLEILPCNPDTRHYYDACGIKFDLTDEIIPTKKEIEKVISYFESNDVKVKI